MQLNKNINDRKPVDTSYGGGGGRMTMIVSWRDGSDRVKCVAGWVRI